MRDFTIKPIFMITMNHYINLMPHIQTTNPMKVGFVVVKKGKTISAVPFS